MASNNNLSSSSKKPKYKKNALDFVDRNLEYMMDSKYKTELCLSFQEKHFCPYGNKCRFAHGKEELFDKSTSLPNYRKNDCVSFHTLGYCTYGARCHFRHYQSRSLSSMTRSYYSYLLKCYPIFENYVKPGRLKIFQDISNQEVLVCRGLSFSNESMENGINMNMIRLIDCADMRLGVDLLNEDSCMAEEQKNAKVHEAGWQSSNAIDWVYFPLA